MGARRGARGALAPPPWNFKKWRNILPSYKIPQNFRSRLRRSPEIPYIFQSKTSQKTQKVSFAPSGAAKTCQLFKVLGVFPPSGKISAGAHACTCTWTHQTAIWKDMYMKKQYYNSHGHVTPTVTWSKALKVSRKRKWIIIIKRLAEARWCETVERFVD